MTAGPKTEATQWVRARTGGIFAAATRGRLGRSPAHGKGHAIHGRSRAVLDEKTERVGNLGNGLRWASAM
jgi:hypothetical protein